MQSQTSRIVCNPETWKVELTDDRANAVITNLKTEKESILSTEIITNPFIFNNTEKEDIDYRVRHAESKATNTFHPDKTKVKYDDSKDRKTN